MADKQEIKYEPRFFRQWQGEGKPDPDSYLFKNKSKLISTAVFCEVMAERLKELTHHHCGKTLIPDVAGGLIDTPVDDVPIRMRVKTTYLEAYKFMFELSEFPITYPADWYFAPNDSTDRAPVHMGWKKRRTWGQEKTKVIRETSQRKIEYTSETGYENISDRTQGYDDDTNEQWCFAKQVETAYDSNGSVNTAGAVTIVWQTNEADGKFYKTTTTAAGTESEEVPMLPFNPWRNFASIIEISKDELNEDWLEVRPAVQRLVERNGDNSADEASVTWTVESKVEQEWNLDEKWTMPSLFSAMRAQIDSDAITEYQVSDRATTDFIVAGFGTDSHLTRGLSELMKNIIYFESDVAPILEARFDDGNFIVERESVWEGISDTHSGRADFIGRNKPDVRHEGFHGWTYYGNAQPLDPILPWETFKPIGYGNLYLRDVLWGISRKMTEGIR